MQTSIDCGKRFTRRRRNLIEKVLCSAAFHCKDCGAESRHYRSFFAIFQSYCQCPVCHNRDLTKLAKRDKLDRMHPNPLRRLLQVFHAPLYHCTFCRLQFRDWRGLAPNRKAASEKRAG